MTPRLKAARAAAAAFKEMGWTWSKGGDHVPSADEIAETLRSLANTVRANRGGFASTGRLSVEWIDDTGWTGVGYSLDLGDDVEETTHER